MAIYLDISHLDIDMDALTKSEKYLTIIFAVLTALTNGVMLTLSICSGMDRSSGQSTSAATLARRGIFVSLGVGGFLLASFTYVVLALQLFQQEGHDLDCLTMTLAQNYGNEFLPVLYACGLVLMTIDVIIIQPRTTTSVSAKDNNKWTGVAVLCAVLPWVTSLTIVCPLSLTSIAWNENCKPEQSRSHTEARMVVCTLVPALVVLASGLCALLWQTSGSDESSNDTLDFPMYQGEGHNTMDSTERLPTNCLYAIGHTTHVDPFYTGYSNQHIHANKPTHPQHATSSFDHRSDNSSLPRPQNPQKQSFQIQTSRDDWIRKWKRVVFVSCCLFVMSVVPYNAMCVYVMETFDPQEGKSIFLYRVDKTVFIAVDVGLWVQAVYPSLLPLVWGMSSF